MKNFDRGSSGITLIALVVTIIVLLILVGVSIWTLTGNKNIINQSFEAKNQADYKDVEEEVMQQWLLVQNDTRNEYPDNSTLAAKLQERLASKNSSASVSYLDNHFDIDYKGYRLNFDLQTQSIAQDLLPTQYKKVEYIESTGTQYIDTNYIPVNGDDIEIKNITTNRSTNNSIFSAGTGTYQLILLEMDHIYFKNFASGNAPYFGRMEISDSNIKINDGNVYVNNVHMCNSVYERGS